MAAEAAGLDEQLDALGLVVGGLGRADVAAGYRLLDRGLELLVPGEVAPDVPAGFPPGLPGPGAVAAPGQLEGPPAVLVGLGGGFLAGHDGDRVLEPDLALHKPGHSADARAGADGLAGLAVQEDEAEVVGPGQQVLGQGEVLAAVDDLAALPAPGLVPVVARRQRAHLLVPLAVIQDDQHAEVVLAEAALEPGLQVELAGLRHDVGGDRPAQHVQAAFEAGAPALGAAVAVLDEDVLSDEVSDMEGAPADIVAGNLDVVTLPLGLLVDLGLIGPAPVYVGELRLALLEDVLADEGLLVQVPGHGHVDQPGDIGNLPVRVPHVGAHIDIQQGHPIQVQAPLDPAHVLDPPVDVRDGSLGVGGGVDGVPDIGQADQRGQAEGQHAPGGDLRRAHRGQGLGEGAHPEAQQDEAGQGDHVEPAPLLHPVAAGVDDEEEGRRADGQHEEPAQPAAAAGRPQAQQPDRADQEPGADVAPVLEDLRPEVRAPVHGEAGLAVPEQQDRADGGQPEHQPPAPAPAQADQPHRVEGQGVGKEVSPGVVAGVLPAAGGPAEGLEAVLPVELGVVGVGPLPGEVAVAPGVVAQEGQPEGAEPLQDGPRALALADRGDQAEEAAHRRVEHALGAGDGQAQEE